MPPLSQAQIQLQHQEKIRAAKLLLEENEGKKIKDDKIQEWALLEICEKLTAIHFALTNRK